MTVLAEPRTETDPTTATDHGRPALRRLGGVALIAGPVLILGGMLTCPPQDSLAAADYIASLARVGWLTELSALLLHYGLIVAGLGALAVPGLLRGRRGRVLTVAGAVATAIGLLNVSGAVRDDWWRMVTGQRLPLDVAVAVSDAVDRAPLMVFWSGTELLAFAGLLALSLGLARAGVTGWWPPVVFVAAFVGMTLIPVHLTYVVGVAFTLMYTPLAVAGALILRRERLR
jgi:hypothetical protein